MEKFILMHTRTHITLLHLTWDSKEQKNTLFTKNITLTCIPLINDFKTLLYKARL